jgi:cytochrome c-type biogenesis protein CcmE
MYGRKVKLRFFFVLSVLFILAFSAFLILKSLEENVIYFQSPSEIKSLSEIEKKKDKSWRNGQRWLHIHSINRS